MEEAVLNTLNSVGGAIGIPAALFLGWLYLRVRQQGEDVASLRKEIADMKDKHAEEVSAIRQENSEAFGKLYEKMNVLAGDIAFIRGTLEKCK